MSEVLPMPMFVFVNDKLACQCTRADAPTCVAAYQKQFPKAKVQALTALQVVKAGFKIPKSRRTLKGESGI